MTIHLCVCFTGGKDLPLPNPAPTTSPNGYRHQAPPATAPPPHYPMHPNQMPNNAYQVANNAKQVLKSTDYCKEPRQGSTYPTSRFEDGTTFHHDPPPHYTTPVTTDPTHFHTARETNTPSADATDAVPTLNSQPALDELLWLEGNGTSVRLITRVASEWEGLALNLGIQRYVMRVIQRDHTKCEDACTVMFKRWLWGDGIGPRTWGRVVTALEGINDNETAYLIRQVLGEHSQSH